MSSDSEVKLEKMVDLVDNKDPIGIAILKDNIAALKKQKDGLVTAATTVIHSHNKQYFGSDVQKLHEELIAELKAYRPILKGYVDELIAEYQTKMLSYVARREDCFARKQKIDSELLRLQNDGIDLISSVNSTNRDLLMKIHKHIITNKNVLLKYFEKRPDLNDISYENFIRVEECELFLNPSRWIDQIHNGIQDNTIKKITELLELCDDSTLQGEYIEKIKTIYDELIKYSKTFEDNKMQFKIIEEEIKILIGVTSEDSDEKFKDELDDRVTEFLKENNRVLYDKYIDFQQLWTTNGLFCPNCFNLLRLKQNKLTIKDHNPIYNFDCSCTFTGTHVNDTCVYHFTQYKCDSC